MSVFVIVRNVIRSLFTFTLIVLLCASAGYESLYRLWDLKPLFLSRVCFQINLKKFLIHVTVIVIWQSHIKTLYKGLPP